jgi:hypothetical protein
LSEFPGSEQGKVVNLFAGRPFSIVPIQHDVKQIQSDLPQQRQNITTNMSTDCEGVISLSDSKVCTISNIATNQMTNMSAASVGK